MTPASAALVALLVAAPGPPGPLPATEAIMSTEPSHATTTTTAPLDPEPRRPRPWMDIDLYRDQRSMQYELRSLLALIERQEVRRAETERRDERSPSPP